MSSTAGASEESKDKALEMLATYLTDDELVDFSTFNTQGVPGKAEDRERFMLLTNMHQHALYQLGLAIMESEVEGEGAMEVFTGMLAMTAEALRQLKQDLSEDEDEDEEGNGEGETAGTGAETETTTPEPQEAPEVGGGCPGTD
jgi:hypothetical protein